MSQQDSELADDEGFETLDEGSFQTFEELGEAPEEPSAETTEAFEPSGEEVEEAGEEEEAKPKRVVVVEKPRANVYTIMLIVSLVALTIGCVSLYGEMKLYDMDFKAKTAR